MKNKSIFRIFLGNVGGFLVFLLFLAIASYLTKYLDFSTLKDVVGFFNSSITFLFIMMVVSLVSEISWNFSFPVNLPAPFFSGFLGFLIVLFLAKMSEVVGFISEDKIAPYGGLVFAIVLIIGYMIVFGRLISRDKEKDVWKDFKEDLKKEFKDTLSFVKRDEEKKDKVSTKNKPRKKKK